MLLPFQRFARKAMSCLGSVRNYFSSDITAGVIIIGDEILKGVPDVNTPFLIKQLRNINVSVRKVAIVPDDVDAIAEEVSELSSKCSFVLTSGGIGPTHDDVTYEAVAKACNDILHLNEELFSLLVDYFGSKARENPGIVKYSHVPTAGIVNYIDINHNNKLLKYPVISVKNIYILPGVPSLLQKSFDLIKSKYASCNREKFTKDIYIYLDEFTVTAIFNEAVRHFKGYVKFGSYPTFTDNYYKIKLTIESPFEEWIKKAHEYLILQLPVGSIVNLKKDVLLFASEDVYLLCKSSMRVSSAVLAIEAAFQKYSLSELCICFNGGKDCTILLHLLYACVQRLKPHEWNRIHVLYVRNGETFDEVESFIQSTAQLYKFTLTILKGDLKETISDFLKQQPDIKAMLMGTRSCDPGASNLGPFSKTDSDWPHIVRIMPILSWSYSDIWHFIRELQIPYCILYDQGYTSLGLKSQTKQNPLLQLDNSKGFLSYKPAYMLSDHKSERHSRT